MHKEFEDDLNQIILAAKRHESSFEYGDVADERATGYVLKELKDKFILNYAPKDMDK